MFYNQLHTYVELLALAIVNRVSNMCSYARFFQVKFPKEYPQCAPTVMCSTPIYHPNIVTASNVNKSNVCLSLLDTWGPTNTLEDMVQGLLFLMHHPNVEDPYSELITSSMPMEQFEMNARAIYQEGKNPLFHDEKEVQDEYNAYNDEYDEFDDEFYVTYAMRKDFFAPAVELYKSKSREEWKAQGTQRTEEWEKTMEDENFIEKVKKWEEEEKIRLEKEEERQRKEEEERQRMREKWEHERAEEEVQRRNRQSSQMTFVTCFSFVVTFGILSKLYLFGEGMV